MASTFAKKCPQARNAAFEKSQAAYKAGDGAGAKHWSNVGKKHDAEAKRLQDQACEWQHAATAH